MNIYVDRRGVRRVSETPSTCNNSVFVLSQRDAPASRMLRYAPSRGFVGGFHVSRAVPMRHATADELRNNDRVLVPSNGDLGFLLTQQQMKDGERVLTRFFDFEQMRTYGGVSQ